MDTIYDQSVNNKIKNKGGNTEISSTNVCKDSISRQNLQLDSMTC